jgi:ABC-2 type transport system permease protein
MFLSGVFWQLDIVPPFLRTVARMLPLYHFHRGLRQLMIVQTMQGVFVPFAVLGIGAVISLSLAVAATSWQDFG